MVFELSKLDRIVQKANERLDAFAKLVESSLEREELAVSTVKKTKK